MGTLKNAGVEFIAESGEGAAQAQREAVVNDMKIAI
jgi:hypothetical protein